MARGGMAGRFAQRAAITGRTTQKVVWERCHVSYLSSCAVKRCLILQSDWLRRLLSDGIKPTYTHRLKEESTIILLREQWGPCNIRGVDVQGQLDARVRTTVDVQTSFGITIITTLQLPLDLSNSYLHFKNQGDIYSVFSLEAMAQAKFELRDREIFGLQNFPGATFSIPKLLTVGPNFKIYAGMEAEVTFRGRLESRVDIAKWDIQQTYPLPSDEFHPQALARPKSDATIQGLRPPTLDWEVRAAGSITAHIKPTLTFGVEFDPIWQLGKATVELQADGWMRLHASVGASSGGDNSCPFRYGIDVGANLKALANAPPSFNWSPQPFQIADTGPRALVASTCPARQRIKRETTVQPSGFNASPAPGATHDDNGDYSSASRGVLKRGPEDPVFKLPAGCFFCPTTGETGANDCARMWNEEIEPSTDNDALERRRKRDLKNPFQGSLDITSTLEKRGRKSIRFCNRRLTVQSPNYDAAGAAYRNYNNIVTYSGNVDDCSDLRFGVSGPMSSGRATEHVLEFQLLPDFFDHVAESINGFCDYFALWWGPQAITINVPGVAAARTGLVHAADAYPGHQSFDTPHNTEEFVILESGVNGMKERVRLTCPVRARTLIVPRCGASPAVTSLTTKSTKH